jgi:hypothetical protein
MTAKSPRFFLVHLLPFLHLVACFVIAIAGLQRGWQYLWMIDVPASLLAMFLGYYFDHPLILFGIIGTVWWYLLSRAIEIFATRLWTALHRRRADQP